MNSKVKTRKQTREEIVNDLGIEFVSSTRRIDFFLEIIEYY